MTTLGMKPVQTPAPPWPDSILAAAATSPKSPRSNVPGISHVSFVFNTMEEAHKMIETGGIVDALTGEQNYCLHC